MQPAEELCSAVCTLENQRNTKYIRDMAGNGGKAMKPVIGITCNYDSKDTVGMTSHMGIAGQDWNFVAGDYIYAVEKAGGIPVILPRLNDMEVLAPFMERLDGVIITGGHDVNPKDYGARITGKCGRIVPERDEMDLMITHFAYDHRIPMLGICRGAQIMAVAFGGTMYQDVEAEGGFQHHFMDNSPREYAVHKNKLMRGTALWDIFGKDEIEVNSYHHQAIRTVGENTTVAAVSEDGVIEAAVIGGGPEFCLAVQWHPEMMFASAEQQKIFGALIEASQKKCDRKN